MKRYGCIGKKLTHSFSKEIHAQLADYSYELIELEPQELAPFFQQRDFAAINVTIPYKQDVLPFLDRISPVARRIGAVNTIVNENSVLCGYNTDYYGMKALIERMGLSLADQKVLILGTGGTAKTASVLAADLGAREILRVSRREGEDSITYEQASRLHGDAQILINTTPSGMYPNCEEIPVDLSCFPQLKGVVDAVYNPLRTRLVLEAQDRGIRAEGGLFMLVMQAVAAVETFLNKKIPPALAQEVFRRVLAEKENIVLTGMPGSGKSTVGRCLEAYGYTQLDTDAQIETLCGCSVKEWIRTKGEEEFRREETRVIRQLSLSNRRVISTGGGAVLKEENVRYLKQNGRLFFLDAPLSRLRASSDRPLSDTAEKLAALYRQRIQRYRQTADEIVPDLGSPEAEADYIFNKQRNENR